MLMPLGYAKRNALIQFFECGSLRCRVHSSNEFVATVDFLVEKGCWTCGVEGKAFQEAVPVVREVIYGLWQIWGEYVEAIGERNAVVFVPFERLTEGVCEL